MQPTPETNPPPYEDTFPEFDLDDPSDDEDSHQPLTLTINAATSIHGSNNLIQTPPPPPFPEISLLSTSILRTMNQILAVNNISTAVPTTTPVKLQHRTLKVDLTINCGMTVIGDRNVVGGIGLRQRGPTAATAAAPTGTGATADSPAIVGAKRKAENHLESESEPLTKRCAVEGQM